jgi:PPK2 family polyphosphate:nucleotide phosphotransferase
MDFAKRFRVSGKDFDLDDLDPGDKAGLTEEEAQERREKDLERLADLQDRLYAEGRRALLVVLQGLDAAGKDGTIKHVLSGLNPQGVAVTAFKQPTATELAHDFLWRAELALPPRGRIGVFNRSHYEEVLVVRVHPEFLGAQGIDPERAGDRNFWEERFEDIATWERHLARDGTRIVKFFLNISRKEQRKRFLARAEDPRKRWKFRAGDIAEREHWDAYREAYAQALKATSTKDAPWYAVPADHKWVLRTVVADIVAQHLEDLDPRYPELSPEEREEMDEALRRLRDEDEDEG